MTVHTPRAAAASQPKFGRYRLLERLSVHRDSEAFYALEACEDGSARPIILRRLLLSASEDPEQRDRFRAVIDVAARMRDPRLLRVLDTGVEEGQPYVTSAAVQGIDLERTLRFLHARKRSLPPALALHVGDEAFGAVAAWRHACQEHPDLPAAHGRLSPALFVLGLHGQIWLDHVGLLTAMPAVEHATGSELAYVAPEQIEGNPPDARADVFAAAVMLSEMLGGHPWFRGDSDLAVLLSIRETDTSSSTSDLPCQAALRELLARALSRSPDERPADLDAFLKALRAHRPERPPDLEEAVAELVAEARQATHVERREPERRSPLRPPPAPQSFGSAADHLAEYQARTTSGALLGPWRFFRVVEAVATGELQADARISIAGGAFRNVSQLPQLARYLPSSARAPLQPENPLATYDFAEGGLLRALMDGFLESREGLLLCEYGNLRKEVFLSKGLPHSVTSNLASDLLGEQLVRRHVITRSELDMALVVMPRYGGRLGDTLVALGLVEPLQLASLIVEQVRERLIELFTWPNGAAMLYPNIEPPEQTVPLGLDLWTLLEEGMRRRMESELDPASATSRPHPATPGRDGARAAPIRWPEQAAIELLEPRAGQLAATAGVPPDVRQLLQEPSGSRTTAEACRMLSDPTGNDSQRPSRILALLRLVGAVTPSVTPPPRGAAGRRHPQASS